MDRQKLIGTLTLTRFSGEEEESTSISESPSKKKVERRRADVICASVRSGGSGAQFGKEGQNSDS